MKILSIFGTRPEAIKMAPLLRKLQSTPNLESVICVTGQHRNMLDQVMELFALEADHDLNVMMPDQSLSGLFARTIERVDEVLVRESPHAVLVHGDTTTACAGALAAFHRQIPVGHIEAGLRTGDLSQPFPEEMNRRVIDGMSEWLFAPTPLSRDNLLRENVAGHVYVTGNTVIDALALTCESLGQDEARERELSERYRWLDPDLALLLVTGHRRENFGAGFEGVCTALLRLAQRQDLQIVYPVHLNPRVRATVMSMLGGQKNIHLIEPLPYLDFVWFMHRSDFILTDSGGVQEEAPYLGKPVFVMRDVTERPEALQAGTIALVGTNPDRIESKVSALLDEIWLHGKHYRRISPYGDGRASERIVAALCGQPVQEFVFEMPPVAPVSLGTPVLQKFVTE